MSDTLVTDSIRAAVERRAGDEPEFLAAARRDALERYAAAPLPDRVHHLWRYTDPRRLLPGDRVPEQPSAQFGQLPDDCTDGTFEHHAGVAIALDGRVLRSAVDPELGDVVFGDLRSVASKHEGLVRPYLFRLVDRTAGRFEQLSCALYAGGTFLHVPRGQNVDLPFHVTHRIGGDGLVAARSLVVLEEGASATLVLDLLSTGAGGATMLHEGLEIHLAANARLRIVFLQQLGPGTVHAPVIRGRVERDALLETVTVALGGRLVKSEQSVEIAGPGADVRSLGIVFADGRRHVDHHTLMDHIEGRTSSDLDFRAVVADRARSAYTGNLRIGLEGALANAHQRNHNLLLSDKARADTIPELEILTNDVQCSHAAAVGPLDEDLLYFCACRGISEDEARRLIVLGFLEPVVARVPSADLQDRVRGVVERRLTKAEA